MTREEAIKVIEGRFEIMDYCESARLEEALDIAVESLKQPQPRKKGKWIETEFLKLRECSCCHVQWGMYDVENFNFCPDCGADMREPFTIPTEIIESVIGYDD